MSETVFWEAVLASGLLLIVMGFLCAGYCKGKTKAQMDQEKNINNDA